VRSTSRPTIFAFVVSVGLDVLRTARPTLQEARHPTFYSHPLNSPDTEQIERLLDDPPNEIDQ
jgi:hypothetical protein